MKLVEKLTRYANDFTGILECEHCGSFQHMSGGYSDARFYNQVIPAIKCVACDKRQIDIVPEGISDPGYQGGILAKKISVSVEKWVPVENERPK
jgi:hypothetical protein